MHDKGVQREPTPYGAEERSKVPRVALKGSTGKSSKAPKSADHNTSVGKKTPRKRR
jgi:hypothetical protein